MIAFTLQTNAQSVSINFDGSLADPSAILDIKSTDKGFLIPRIDFGDKPANPPAGLLIYVTANGPYGDNLFYYYDGSVWTPWKNMWERILSDITTAGEMDVITQGNFGIGFDANPTMDFKGSNVVLKENNTRFLFSDADTIINQPKRDWLLKANESASGGKNYFSILDVSDVASGGDQIVEKAFTIEVPTSNQDFYLKGNNLGFGTNQPQKQLHIMDGNTSSIRISQNTSQALDPIDWDMASNHEFFSINDALNSTTPLIVETSAPGNSFYLDSNGNTGFGTDEPDRQFHVNGTMRLEPLATPPANPTKGDLYFDDNDNILKCYDGSQWQDLW